MVRGNKWLTFPRNLRDSALARARGQELDGGGVSSAITRESCRLRELNLVKCENMTSVNLRNTVDSLKFLGVWNGMERVVVQRSKHLVYDEVVDIIGEERLQHLS